MQYKGLAVKAALGVILGTALIASYGCESAIDCLDNDGPEFVTGAISDPVLNQVYAQTITVEINNEPRDDNFRYNFSLSGALPEGVSAVANGRNYIFNGTPIEEGTFRFTVFVNVDDSLEPVESGLCYYNASKSYEITVQPL